MRNAGRRWRQMLSRLSTILLSVTLGVIVWLIAVNQENPLVTGEYAETITLQAHGLAEGLQPVQPLSDTIVRLTLRAPKNIWTQLNGGDLHAWLDVTGLKAGLYTLPIQTDSRLPEVFVTDLQPREVSLQLDPVITQEIAVRAEVMDSVAFGYDWQTPIMTPSTITVRGPASQVHKVTNAQTQVYVRSARNQVERLQTIDLLSSSGQPVENVVAEPSTVNIVVPVERWPGRKDVAVTVKLAGQPAAGYRLGAVKLEPATVVLRGNSDVLNQMTGFVETAPLDVTGATETVRIWLDLLLPQGVTAFDSNKVYVVVEIEPLVDSRTITLKPTVRGNRSDLHTTVSPDTVQVILSGPVSMLEALGTDDMFVVVDVSGLVPGSHTLTPLVLSPPGLQQEGVLPQTVEVVITNPGNQSATPQLGVDVTVPISPILSPNVTPSATSTVTSTKTPTTTVTPAIKPVQ